MRPIPRRKIPLNLAIAAVVTSLVIAGCRIAYDRSVLHGVSSSLERSNTAQPQIRFAPAKLTPTDRASKPQTSGGETAKAPSSSFRRIRVGPNEVDYIAEDVTIRHFTTNSALPRVRNGYKEVHVGEDVTVRYFASKPAVVSQARPVSTLAPSLDPSLPVSK